VKAVLPTLRGAFALAIAFRQFPDFLIGARLGSPLVVGYGEGETYLGSDALALAPLTQKIAYLEEGDWVIITHEGAQIFDRDNNPVEREITTSGVSAAAIEKGNYRHYMQKEIFEQPTVVAQTLSSYIRPLEQTVALPQMDFDLGGVKRITIVACGTSYYAGMVAKYWFETFARVPVDIDVASEFRYRDPVLEEGGLALFISQSGRDGGYACRIEALQGQWPDHRGCRQCADVEHGARGGFAAAHPCRAGNRRRLDQGLHLPACGAGGARRASRAGEGQAVGEEEREIVRHLIEAPAALNAALAHDDDIAAMAHLIAPARDVLYLGRGPDYPLALEGALKLKEISYIHAEGYASGRDEARPDRADRRGGAGDRPRAVSGPLFEKTVSNMQEVRARGGKMVLISDAEGIAEAGEGCLATIEMPARASADRAAGLCGAGAVARLPCRLRQGDRCGPAAQSGEERDGGVATTPLASALFVYPAG
jgi:glucosamine--fructose-6-phosphate aminotransferase (isomerizing)